ncbi:FAD-dependent oxidoreductase domain-containing protein 2 isoform X1 [Rhineura floridana]|uniref:FAD-dependent oxidoreductase domain-containing protein 2 isoform X1 n=1 Tax=Rhineura floridana TaxID=261503 RepID=UPI002AC8791B|nr:FAD-dependent oxidoreductase domain-containing protein 2 isoform X1 [Rhineura floridana]XP_061495007.1 FAD-dependent oxidoreductase domain-containing protein 2 isoform X1 [Rhineura floridana]XP_061495008.1 FAD-dependent oxidoreductase domain-containing protein 2 isoform X1 [Rhineura floridana]XP_061495009.1 FAD-dependent oxidoreductase domain-containing protein 2 isoform X1 [Rhineura floridana]XP_061495010.1 FAD-dependent oxidoreductase domain-containing protein 2 isoform X1 [Rhineura florid
MMPSPPKHVHELLLAFAFYVASSWANDILYHDYCIIGAGPAGLQMAYFLQHAGRDYVVFERGHAPGCFFALYPRHRKLISVNKRYTGKSNGEFNLRHDWNSLLSHDSRLLFRHYSKDFFPNADDMVRYLGDFASMLDLQVCYNTSITHVMLEKDSKAWNGHYFILADQNARFYKCSVLLVATGTWVPHEVNFPGSEYVEGYESVSVDPEDFVGQSVLILGRGNSAFETAENILGVTNFVHMVSRSRVRLSWATHYVGDLRAINNGLLDTYQLKSLDGLLEGDLEDLVLVKDKKGKLRITLRFYLENSNSSEAESITLPQDELDNFATRAPYDRAIRCLGWKFDFSIFNKSVGLMQGKGSKKKYPLIKPSYEAKATRGLFVLGTASHSVDFRKSAGGFIHGFRYTARTVHRILEVRHHGVPWPSPIYPIMQLTNTIVKRVNEASGLYQMFSVLADVILLKENAPEFEYLEEYPVGVLQELEWRTGKKVQNGLFVIMMEYGKNFSGPDKDVFYYNRAVGEAQHAWQSNFLHPVIYYYKRLPTERQMRLCPPDWPLPRPDAIHHIVEDFLTDWTAPNAHILPLRRFLENCLETDLRRFYAESCFLFALTRQKLPPFCQQGYMRMQGLMHNERLRHHGVESGLLEDYAAVDSPNEQEGGSTQSHDQLLEDPMILNHQLQHLMSTKDEL